MDDILYLITQRQEQDETGVIRPVLEERLVFCKVASITRAEFFNAGRSGLNPDYQMTIFFGDYHGESACEYNGLTYTIYRTYRTDSDYLELYLERRGGTNGLREKPAENT